MFSSWAFVQWRCKVSALDRGFDACVLPTAFIFAVAEACQLVILGEQVAHTPTPPKQTRLNFRAEDGIPNQPTQTNAFEARCCGVRATHQKGEPR
jgi:hypothetical protein